MFFNIIPIHNILIMIKKRIVLLIIIILVIIIGFKLNGKLKYLDGDYYRYIPFTIAEKDNKLKTYIEGEYEIDNYKITSYNYYYINGYNLEDLYFIVKNEINDDIESKYIDELVKKGKESLKNDVFGFKYENQNYKIMNYYQFSYEMGLMIKRPHPNTLNFEKEQAKNIITDFKVVENNDIDYKLLFKSYNTNSSVYLKGISIESFTINDKEHSIDELDSLKINSDLFTLCFKMWKELRGENGRESLYINDDRFSVLNIAKYKDKYISYVKSKNGDNIDYFYHLFSSDKDMSTVLCEDLEMEFKLK